MRDTSDACIQHMRIYIILSNIQCVFNDQRPLIGNKKRKLLKLSDDKRRNMLGNV